MTQHRINTKRRFGEAGCYVFARIDGKPALFTEDQIKVALDRAKRQPEDLPRRKWWQFWQ